MGAEGRRAAWIAAGLVAAFAVPLLVGEPYWPKVAPDDAFMAMAVHGHGISTVPSPALVFSSVLYGALIQAIGVHSMGGVQLYSIFTYALLAAAGAGAACALWRAAVNGPLAAAALIVVFAPAVLYPQFTVVAGLLAASAMLLVLADGRAAATVLASLLLVFSALVRSEEALVVLLFTAPFWAPALRRAPRPRLLAGAAALAAFLAALVAGTVADRLYYAAPEWQEFVAINKARLLFTDYGLRAYFFGEPLDPMRLGWLPNDLVMIENWFYSDPRVFSPARLTELADTASFVGRLWSNAKRVDEALAPFQDESFVALLAFALLVAWRARSRVPLWTLAALGAAMIVVWLVGRPGTTRVYVPPLAAIALCTLIAHPAPLGRLHAVLLTIGLALAATVLGLRNAADRTDEEQARAALCTMPKDRLYIVWSERIHFEKLYRPLSAGGDGCGLRLYPLSVYGHAPQVLEQLRAATGASDVVTALLEGKELDMIADGWQIDVLRRHLRSHYRRILDWRLLRGSGGRGSWYRVRVLPESRR